MNLEKYFKIERSYSINNGLIDVEGDVILIKQVDKLPFKFGKVSGNFNCSYNQLTNLSGCPKEIKGDFHCNENLHNEKEYVRYLIIKKLTM